MGFMNLLKANYTGKLGETVGQGWNDQHIIRTYQESKPSNTEGQQEQKERFLRMVKPASIFWQSQYNMKPPAGYKGNPFNYFCKAFLQIIETDLRITNGIKLYCTSPKPILFMYLTKYKEKVYFLFNRSILGDPKDIISFEWKTSFMDAVTMSTKQWIPPEPKNAIIDSSFPQVAQITGFSKHFLYDTGEVIGNQHFTMYQVNVKTKTKTFQSFLYYGMVGIDLSSITEVPNA